jgi:PAS domain S-box-containing protein
VISIYHTQFFESLCNQIPMGIGVLHNATASLIYINSLAKEQYLCRLPMSLSEFMVTKLLINEAEANLLEAAVKERKTIRKSLVSDTEKSNWAQLVVEPMKDNHEYAIMYLSDLSAAAKSEEILLKEIQKFEALFNHASIGIILVNREGNIVVINPFANKQFGYTNSELIGKKIEVLIPQRFQKAHVGHRAGFEKKPENRSMGTGLDLFALRKDGTEFPIQISLGHFHNEEGSFTLAYVFDDTERKNNEIALLKQQEQMVLVNKKMKELNELLEVKVTERTQMLHSTMKELELSRDNLEQALTKEKELNDMKSRFVSMASHEFRTPLSTILSSVTLLSKYTQSEEQTKREKHIERIKGAVTNLTDILNEFLSLGKIEDGKVEPKWMVFDMNEAVNAVIRQMDPLRKPGQYIKHRHNGNAEVMLDPGLIKNILINLISNALKFSPDNSAIEIITETKEISFSLSVKDKGMGISKEDQEHLFERFFRGANATNIQGTGLGLHIVSRYIQLMNGSIQCMSTLEEGTTFIVEFPHKILAAT